MNKSLSYLLFFAIAVYSCKSDTKEVALDPIADIIKLEDQYRSTNDPALAQELLTKYITYATENPTDAEKSGKYLRRSAQIYSSNQDYIKAAGVTVLALKQHYKSTATEANIASLVDYYYKLNNQDAAETTMNGYLMAFPNGAKVADYTNALGDKKQSLVERLNQLAIDVISPSEGQPGINKKAVNKFVGVAEIYALTNNTKDTLTTDFLFKAGKLAMTIGNNDKAIECYHWLHSFLTSAKEAPSALFTHAFTLDNQLEKKEDAKVLYEQFLKKYPDHHFANDAEFQLKNLGKNDAQIIEEFNKRANSK